MCISVIDIGYSKDIFVIVDFLFYLPDNAIA
jgi:hypothetical protein